MTPTKKTTPSTPTADSVATAAAIALGADYTAAFEAADKAIAEERAAAVDDLIDAEIRPAAGALSELEWHAERLAPARYGAGMAALHGRSCRTHAELARLCRSPEVLADVAAAADSLAQRDDRGTVAQAAQAAFLSAIAGQLIAAGHELAPAAQRLLDADALAVRLAAARGRHEAHAADLAEKAAAEQRLNEQAQALERERAAAKAAAELQRAEQEIGRPSIGPAWLGTRRSRRNCAGCARASSASAADRTRRYTRPPSFSGMRSPRPTALSRRSVGGRAHPAAPEREPPPPACARCARVSGRDRGRR